MNFIYPLEGCATALGLRKVGNEYHGPCPNCGGHGKKDADRFWLKPGKTKDIIYACRQCADGSAIAKRLIDLGLVQPDSDYEAPRHRYDYVAIQRAKRLAMWLNFELDNMNWAGVDKPSIHVLYDLATQVDPDTRRYVEKTLDRARRELTDFERGMTA